MGLWSVHQCDSPPVILTLKSERAVLAGCHIFLKTSGDGDDVSAGECNGSTCQSSAADRSVIQGYNRGWSWVAEDPIQAMLPLLHSNQTRRRDEARLSRLTRKWHSMTQRDGGMYRKCCLEVEFVRPWYVRSTKSGTPDMMLLTAVKSSKQIWNYNEYKFK